MEISLEHIALHDLDISPVPILLLQVLGERAIDLHRDEPAASLYENVGERPPTRTDLDNRIGRSRSKRVDDSLENSRVGQEVLPALLEHGWPAHVQLLATRCVRSSLLGTLLV